MFKNTYSKVKSAAQKRPLAIFFALLALLLSVIVAGNALRAPQENNTKETSAPKQVSLYDPTGIPRMDMAAKVDKKNSITITAGVSGIVSHISVLDGQAISAGQPIITLADTYNGQRAASVGETLAQDTSKLTGEISDREASIADQNLKDSPKDSSTETVILRKQLAIQKRSAELNATAAQLKAEQASISNAMYAPVSPAGGTVDRVYVSPGDYVSPGTALATISLNQADTLLEVLVPLDIASLVSVEQPTLLLIAGETQELYPISISKEATRGQNYSVLYTLPAKDAPYLANNSFVSLSLPFDSTSEHGLLVPIDVVTIARNASYVFVAQDTTAEARIVKTGHVYGAYVEILDGITPEDRIIMDRNILDGEKIVISNH